jgi:hypothetical protein
VCPCPGRHLTSPALRAPAAGTPVDSTRIATFERLAGALADLAPAPLPTDDGRRARLPFYEAYFSNYIEGTESTLDEAAAIVFDGDVPDTRPADADDILGTYQLTSSVEEMSRVAHTGEQLLDLLRQRHAVLMGGRPDSLPGQFKVRANSAGSTHFVGVRLLLP